MIYFYKLWLEWRVVSLTPNHIFLNHPIIKYETTFLPKQGGVYEIYNINAATRGQFLCIADNNVKPPADYAVQIEVTFSPYCEAQMDTVGQVQNRRFSAKLDCIVAGKGMIENIVQNASK